jgi:hypothetical protein
LVPTRSNVKRKATVRSSSFFPSLRSAPGRTPKTNGSARPSGIASRSSAQAAMSSSKAASSARPTSGPKARRPRLRRSRLGRFALKPCASSIAADPSRMLLPQTTTFPQNPTAPHAEPFVSKRLPALGGEPFLVPDTPQRNAKTTALVEPKTRPFPTNSSAWRAVLSD